MLLKITNLQIRENYSVWVKFNDGAEGVANLKEALTGEMFEALNDLKNFNKVQLDAELGTLVWPNGADLAPAFLYDRLRVEIGA